MADISLYTEDEESWFATDATDKKGRSVNVTIFASTGEGAQNRIDKSAKDYNLVDVGEVEHIGPAERASWFNR